MPLMSERHKHILLTKREILVSNLRLSENFYAPLRANYTLDDDMVDTIKAEKTSADKNGKFLDILARRSDAAFVTFLEALVKTEQDYLALELDRPTAQRLIDRKRQSTGADAELQQMSVQAAGDGLNSVLGGHNGHINDIFVSYQWDSKPVVHMISSKLTSSGFGVWLDVNEISNEVTKEISEGLTKASVVLIFYSGKYCASYNCKAEANYAFQQKKKIIPIRVEADYEPETWLGFIIGGKLRLDFYDTDKLDESFRELLRALDSLGIKKLDEGDDRMTF